MSDEASRDRAGSGLFKSEDWLAVWLGFVIIALVLFGVQPDVPRFTWSTRGELAAQVFGLRNLGGSALVALACLILSLWWTHRKGVGAGERPSARGSSGNGSRSSSWGFWPRRSSFPSS